MDLTNAQKAYVLAWRQEVVTNDTSANMLELLGSVSETEYAALAEWDECAGELDVEPWRTSDGEIAPTKVIARALAFRTDHQCLIPMSIFSSMARKTVPDIPQRMLLAYYAVRGYDIVPPKINFTEEQREIIETFKDHKAIVVNAGPGTGKTTTAVGLITDLVSKGDRVLVLTYTNSAKITLKRRIAADPLLGKLYTDQPFSSKERKSYNPVLLSTVDQLAMAIRAGPGGTRSYGVTTNFEQIVASALLMSKNKQALRIFYENQTVPLFNTIIVDEAQMLTNDRANLIFSIVKHLFS